MSQMQSEHAGLSRLPATGEIFDDVIAATASSVGLSQIKDSNVDRVFDNFAPSGSDCRIAQGGLSDWRQTQQC
jgi:hypothetical protein